MATGSGTMQTEAQRVTLQARQGIINIVASGPTESYVGLPLEYGVTVSNVGDARVRDLVVEGQMPAGMEFVDATHDGQMRGDRVVWAFPTLAEGTSQAVTVRMRGTGEPGFVRNVFSARGVCTGDVSDIVRTKLEGVPAMVIECIDVQDPNKVGESETYEIRVTNQGSANLTNIVVNCHLEEAQEFVSATGPTPTNAKTGDREYTFGPLPALAPRETATWRTSVRCVAQGDIRFHLKVTSDQHGRPVEETESTRVYEIGVATKDVEAQGEE
jgi:uncharacterized repeat protein (TIGR01451 family)